MNESKTHVLTNLSRDGKIVRETCMSLAWVYFPQFAAISYCYI